MKERKLLLVTLSLFLLASCSTRIDLTNLTETPNEGQNENQGEGEGQGEEEVPPVDESKYQISEEYWQENGYNLGFFIDHKFDLTYERYVGNTKANQFDKFYKFDNNAYYYRTATEEKIIERTSQNAANKYVCVDSVWSLYESGGFDWKSDISYAHLILTLNYSLMHYSNELHAYTCETFDGPGYLHATNIVLKFEDQAYKSMEFDMSETVNEVTTDYHVKVTVTNWGQTTVEIPQV